MVVAVVTSHLANSMKQQTELARKREKEKGDLYAFSRRLAGGAVGRRHLSARSRSTSPIWCNARSCCSAPVPHGEAGAGRARARRCAPPSPTCRRGRIARDHVDAGTGDIWLVRRVSEQHRRFRRDRHRSRQRAGGADRATCASASTSALSDAAATLEHLDVARALGDARMRSETELLREALIGSVSHELRTPLASILGAATVLASSPAVAKDERLSALAGGGARRGRAPQPRHPEPARCHPRQPRADPAAAGMDRAAGHHQLRARAAAAAARRPSRRPRYGLQSAAHLCRSGSGRAGASCRSRQRGQIFAGGIAHHARRQAQRPRRRAVGARRGRRPHATRSRRRWASASSAATAPSPPPRPGSGLGLWIAKAFVAANGGTIEAVSAGADRGTTVAIHLPLRDACDASPRWDPMTEANPRRTHRRRRGADPALPARRLRARRLRRAGRRDRRRRAALRRR